MTIELSAASAFFYNLKHADYAAPDTTGELEGKFKAPLKQVVEAMVQLVVNELKTAIAYRAYAATIRGTGRAGPAVEFLEHAGDETDHADWLLGRIGALVGTVPLPDVPTPPPSTDQTEILMTMIRMEQEGIAKWRILRSLVGDENPMRFQIEEYLTKEQHHLDELWKFLPYKAASVSERDISPETESALHASHMLRNAGVGGVVGSILGPSGRLAGLVGGGVHGHMAHRDEMEAIERDGGYLPKKHSLGRNILGVLTAPLGIADIALGHFEQKARKQILRKLKERQGEEKKAEIPQIDPGQLGPGTQGVNPLNGPTFSEPPPPVMQVEEGVAPEGVDPALEVEVQMEEKGRAQEAEQAAQYFEQQANEATQTIQVLQQQLEGQAQMQEQLQQQLQQEQMQREQAQQMAQQASNTATQSLQQQLESHSLALQSRQMATQVLQHHDGLKQQLRELIDPPPAPPAEAAPPGQAAGAPAQGPAPAPPAAAPKTASDDEKKDNRLAIGGAAAGLLGGMAMDIALSKRRSGTRGLLTTAIPAALSVADLAYQLRPGREGRAQEAVQKAQQNVSSLEQQFQQDGSRTNALRLLSSKTQLLASEINRDHPELASIAQAGVNYGVMRSAASTADKGVSVLQRLARRNNPPRAVNPHAPK
jgi:bacterioferritin